MVNVVLDDKCKDFAVDVVNLKKHLNKSAREYNMADQLQRSGTAIGAAYREACFAESDDDFIHKLRIGLKECSESLYWLEILYRTNYLLFDEYQLLKTKADELQRMLIAIINKVNHRKQ